MTNGNEVQKRTEGFGIVTDDRSAELSAIAVAAAAKAEVEASYVMALKKPRNDEDARIGILNVCKNPIFAEKAIYKKPVGGQTIEGPSIRFAEEMLRHWGNVKTLQSCIFEDELKRIVKITVIDLESNLSYSKEVTVEKKVERKDAKGREVIGERTNSYGQKVFIVRATEDEMQNKEAALASKLIRNNGLRLIPEYIIQEAMETAAAAMKARVNKDPEAEKRKVLDAFAQLGIRPSEIEKYLKHKIDQVTPAEILDLRQVYSALKDGQARWSDYVQSPDAASAPEMPRAKEPLPEPELPTAQPRLPPVNPDIKMASKKQTDTLNKLAAQADLKAGDLFSFFDERCLNVYEITVPEYQVCLKDLGAILDEKAKNNVKS